MSQTTAQEAPATWNQPAEGNEWAVREEEKVTAPIVVAENIHKTFRSGEIEVHALRGVDLTIGTGEMVAIMGPSGCGKTTLLNTLSGLDSFDEGEVTTRVLRWLT